MIYSLCLEKRVNTPMCGRIKFDPRKNNTRLKQCYLDAFGEEQVTSRAMAIFFNLSNVYQRGVHYLLDYKKTKSNKFEEQGFYNRKTKNRTETQLVHLIKNHTLLSLFVRSQNHTSSPPPK